MTLTEAIQQRIRELCRERNITLNHLSMLCGMTQSTVHNIFARPNNSPTISTIKKICDGLDITLGEFFRQSISTRWNRNCSRAAGMLLFFCNDFCRQYQKLTFDTKHDTIKTTLHKSDRLTLYDAVLNMKYHIKGIL